MLKLTMKVPSTADALEGALEGLARVNEAILTREPLPLLYKSGVRYKAEARGAGGRRREEWLTALQTMGRGVGDCEDLAAWRIAELRLRGIDAEPLVVPTGRNKAGQRRYHALVELPDGSTDDPSRRLGMKG